VGWAGRVTRVRNQELHTKLSGYPEILGSDSEVQCRRYVLTIGWSGGL